MNEFYECRDDLLAQGYLPVLIRRLCLKEYYDYVASHPQSRKIKDKIHRTSSYDRVGIVNEFIEWCDSNDYVNLINDKELLKLNNILKDLEVEFQYLKNKL